MVLGTGVVGRAPSTFRWEVGDFPWEGELWGDLAGGLNVSAVPSKDGGPRLHSGEGHLLLGHHRF